MKKLSILLMLSTSLLFVSCGPSEADKLKVCSCEELMVKMQNTEGEYRISEQLSSGEAQKKVQAENQGTYENCVKLHKDIGDDDYFKISQKCKTK